ncbi:MAG: hypothetical protein BWK80_30185 [Desulfobacteraceae bacterium IS3]|nr:MAG: hypothetical protein BWK80_30185 [Desulfobacteraceae bacterium IS3]
MISIKKFSLRIVLAGSFVLLISATAGLISFISLQNEKHTVEDLANQLQDQIVVSIREKLGDYLATPHALNRLNADTIARHPEVTENLEELRSVYIRQLKAFDFVRTVAVGIEKQGNFVGGGRRENNMFASALRDADRTYRVSLIDSQGKAVRLLIETPDYDARTRDWYKAGVAAGKAAWSAVYIWTGNDDIGITAVHPVYDHAGKLLAVHQSALTLDFIARFLKGLRIGKSGQVFLMEQDGMLAASSTSEKPIRKVLEKFERMKADESSDLFIRTAAAHVGRQFKDMSRITGNYHAKLKIDRKPYFITAAKLSDPQGLNWIMITGLPESDVMERIDANTRTSVGLSVIASFIAIWIGILIAHRLTTANRRLESEVAERTRAEEELRQSKEAAETANRAKSAFLSNMSHELRTPLNSVLGYAQILSRQGSTSPAVKDGLQIIAQSGNHLLTLINDILDISKIEAGKMVLHPVPIILKSFLDGITGMIRMRAQEKGLRLICHTDAGLPAGIDADETRLRQVLLNLLGNAVKFTDRGGTVTFRVSVPQSCSDNISLSLEGEGTGPLTLPSPRRGEGVKSSLSLEKGIRLRFEIQDTGVGMTEENMAKIFTPFEQVGDAGRQREGTGLGLAIGRQLVRLMGSDLHVSSEYGSGSMFWFEAVFPVIAAPAQSAQIRSGAIAGYAGPRLKILVADDQPTNRMVLLKMLEPLGFEIALAENGQIAVELARSWHPDLILMDLLMPVMNGFEAVKHIRQFPEQGNVPMIAVSASAFDMDQTQSRKAGCNGFLPKPVDADKLLAFLEEYLHPEWIYDRQEDSPETPAQPESATELVLPPREDIEKLSELAMLGRLPDIADYAAKLVEKDDARYAAFALRLRELAFAYEDAQITELLTQAMEKC